MAQDAIEQKADNSGVVLDTAYGAASSSGQDGGEQAKVSSEQSSTVSDTITGDYSALDDHRQRQEVSTCINAIGSGDYKVNGRGFVNVCGDADLLASGDARVYSRGHAKVAASGNAMIVATDQVKVTASGKVAVCATGTAKVYGSDDVTVVALDRTEVYASGRVKIKAFGSCTVYASGDSEVEVAAQTNCTIFLYGNAKQITVADPEN